MLSDYVQAAMRQATYRVRPEDGCILGEIPGLVGVQARGETLIDCRHDLMEVLEEWVWVRVSRNLPMPDIDGVHLPVKDLL
jgi:predicted RNase H-like HicB family nuclease